MVGLNKKYTIVGLVVITIITGALTAKAFQLYNTCNYNAESGNYVVNNKTYAHGTMDSAFQCALYGVLPQVIIDRLGIFGSDAIKERAKEIIETNKDNQKKE